MVEKLNSLKIKERGDELKVPYYTSAAAVCDGNLPYIIAIPSCGKFSCTFRICTPHKPI